MIRFQIWNRHSTRFDGKSALAPRQNKRPWPGSGYPTKSRPDDIFGPKRLTESASACEGKFGARHLQPTSQLAITFRVLCRVDGDQLLLKPLNLRGNRGCVKFLD